jgi:ATP-dependent DNA helicase RecG
MKNENTIYFMTLHTFLSRRLALHKGIGEKYAALLNNYFIRHGGQEGAVVRDLLFHVPYDYVDKRDIIPLAQAKEGFAVLKLRVVQHLPPQNGRHPHAPRTKRPYRVQCDDGAQSMMLIFFKSHGEYLQKMLPVGQEVVLCGQLQRYDGMWQMTHPDVMGNAEDATSLCRFEAIYPATEGISSKMLGRWIAGLLEALPTPPEWLLPSTRQDYGWVDFATSLKHVHQPQDMQDVIRAKQRLSYDEALAQQLSLHALRLQQQKQAGIPIPLLTTPQMQEAIARLPFTLTEGQAQVLQEMQCDMAGNTRMLRLLQGDVGAGKTVIAALAMLAAAQAGYQAVLMAPTEILARQHVQAIESLLGIGEIPLIFLAGSLTPKQREEAYSRIKSHPQAMIIGTHAVFQDAVQFANLALVIIDEQHRFGVAQRLALSDKGGGEARAFAPHLLLMTATPIPRSLAMAHYGDMDLSQLMQKPAGRQAIDTRTIALPRLPEVMAGVQRAVNAGEKLYWICPLVEESELTVVQSMPQLASLQAAESRFHALQVLFGDKVGLVHGRMAMTEREAVMRAFLQGDVRVLVATTVVEVGVNIPDATIMIIENAERFGLAQLHQLRGRVGRGDKPSRCILLYDEKCSNVAKERLKVMRATNDGFVIAETDWQLRGSGDILGTKQTGTPEFTFLQLESHGDLLEAARQEAEIHLQRDPTLSTPQGVALRELMQCFGAGEAVRFLQSG